MTVETECFPSASFPHPSACYCLSRWGPAMDRAMIMTPPVEGGRHREDAPIWGADFMVA
ncbi:hypothetical protein HNW77_06115 [Komagataeibacter sp. AV436]|uniref:Uncharacterized protein n=1 Tax=Komagataeibacter melomenusus TaxID=2766578 RepID=A0ABX2ACI0_9PROT|nr:hypothetical protein [Komagataeibacter xylinus]NPC65968.1 hypothetical protein [Komagataeibacter melomenusus]